MAFKGEIALGALNSKFNTGFTVGDIYRIQGSGNLVPNNYPADNGEFVEWTADGWVKSDIRYALDSEVNDTTEVLQEQIDDIAEKAGSGYIPKGEVTVATLNGLSGQENGELYTMTDAGTLTDGSLAVVAGDTVAWDATNSVWYKAMDYAPRQYGTNEVHNLPTTITAFRTGDVIPVDGPSGTTKIPAEEIGLSGASISDGTSYTDWNDLPFGKAFLVSYNMANKPTNAASPAIGLTIGSYASSNFAAQFYIGIATKKTIYWRKLQSGTWSDWSEFVNDNLLTFLLTNLANDVRNSDESKSYYPSGYWSTGGTATTGAGRYAIIPTNPDDIICICGYLHNNTSCIVSLENNAFEDGTQLRRISTTGNQCTYAKATSSYTGICFWNLDVDTKIYKLNGGLFAELINLLIDTPKEFANRDAENFFLLANLQEAGNTNETPSTWTNGYWNTYGNWAVNANGRAVIVPTDPDDVLAIYGKLHTGTWTAVSLDENNFVHGSKLYAPASSGDGIAIVRATTSYTGVCFFADGINPTDFRIYKIKSGLFRQIVDNAKEIDILKNQVSTLNAAKTFYVGFGVDDGVTNFSKVWDAMQASVSESGWVNIEINSGTYDLYTEMGGSGYLATISDTTWRNWVPVLNKVRMRGHGDVKITYLPPAEVAALYPNANATISVLNIGGDCEIEDLTLEGQYCRYIIHDQTATGDAEEENSTKIYRNLRCKMIVTSQYGQVVGGGFGVSNIVKFYNCMFEGCPSQSTFSYHQGYRASFVIENCVFIDNSDKTYCVRFGNKPDSVQTYRCPVRFSNCYFSKDIYLNREWGDIQAVNNYDITLVGCNSVNVTTAPEISDIIFTPAVYNTIS